MTVWRFMIASSRSCQSEVPFRLNVGRIRHSIERSFSFSFLSTPGRRRDTITIQRPGLFVGVPPSATAPDNRTTESPSASSSSALHRALVVTTTTTTTTTTPCPNQHWHAGTPGPQPWGQHTPCAAQLRLRLRLPSLSPANDPGALRRPARPAVQSRRVDARRATPPRRARHRHRRLCRRRGIPRRRARPDAPLCLAADRARRPAHGRPRAGAAVRARDRAQ